MRQFTRVMILIFGTIGISIASVFFTFPVTVLFEGNRVVDTITHTGFNPYGLLICLFMIPLCIWYFYTFTWEDDFVNPVSCENLTQGDKK